LSFERAEARIRFELSAARRLRGFELKSSAFCLLSTWIERMKARGLIALSR